MWYSSLHPPPPHTHMGVALPTGLEALTSCSLLGA